VIEVVHPKTTITIQLSKKEEKQSWINYAQKTIGDNLRNLKRIPKGEGTTERGIREFEYEFPSNKAKYSGEWEMGKVGLLVVIIPSLRSFFFGRFLAKTPKKLCQRKYFCSAELWYISSLSSLLLFWTISPKNTKKTLPSWETSFLGEVKDNDHL
jgi:hypothetical protein